MREMSVKPTLVEALGAVEQGGSSWVVIPENVTAIAVTTATHQQMIPFTTLVRPAARDEPVLIEDNIRIENSGGNASSATRLAPKKIIPQIKPLRGSITGILLKETSTVTPSGKVAANRASPALCIATARPPLCRTFKSPNISRLPLHNIPDHSSGKSVTVIQNVPTNADSPNSSHVLVRKVFNTGSAVAVSESQQQCKAKKRAVESILIVCPICNAVCPNHEQCELCGIQPSSHKPRSVKVVQKITTVAPSPNSTMAGPHSVLASKTFYGRKLQAVGYSMPLSVKTNDGNVQKRIVKRVPRKRQCNEPPECLTISSDDEGHDSKDKPESPEPLNKGLDTDVYATSADSSPSNENSSNSSFNRTIEKDAENSQSVAYLPLGPNFVITDVESNCRSIRLGSFKVPTTQPLHITADHVNMTVNTVMNQKEVVTLSISHDDIVQILAHFGRTMPMIILYTNPACAAAIRSRLKMNDKRGPYYDPTSTDETQKRIIILPEDMNDNDRSMMKAIFFEHDQSQPDPPPEGTLREIDQKTANEILVRSTPPEIVDHVNKLASCNMLSTKRGRPVSDEKFSNMNRGPVIIPLTRRPLVDKEIQKVATYPPPPQTGGITITSEDVSCLDQGEFLNDVIIDFYLRYAVLEKLSEEDRKRTHVFSSFFYGRLTRAGPSQYSLRSLGEIDDRSLPPAERRHNRVKTWTRHVDIFEKDFIIIPINENSHWFLAIICYPNLAGRIANRAAEQQTSYSEASSETRASKLVDYADDTDDSTPGSETPTSTPESQSEKPQTEAGHSENEKLPRPCILLFDSLHARNWNKVVGHLREYLKMEWRTKKKSDRVFDSQTIKGAYPTVPQQSNYSDCGVYLLQYVDSFFETPIKNFSLPIPDLRNWFSEETINNKRDEIKNIILRLSREQQEREENCTDNNNEKGLSSSLPTCAVPTVNQEEATESFFKASSSANDLPG